MEREHTYTLNIKWTGNNGVGTSGYSAYDRSHIIYAGGKHEIEGSSDPAFRGDKSRYNPEELLVASLSGCHMLWYLHLCAENGVVVLDYSDEPVGYMQETTGGGGNFTKVILRPLITVRDASMVERAKSLHKQANEKCFIANSVNFKVEHEPVISVNN